MNQYWIWGYVMKEVPERLPFMNQATYCSLETAASYFGADNVVFMNSAHGIDNLSDELLHWVGGSRQIICALSHGAYAESAAKVSEFSLRYPNITGAIIDDFLDYGGPSCNMTPEEMREVHEALKSRNPALKLWVVRYSRHPIDEIEPFLDYIDGINWWIWVSTEHYWRYQYPLDLKALGKYKKPILQGVFLNNYGEGLTQPLSLPLMELQMTKITDAMRNQALWYGHTETVGCVLLQNGWMGKESHRAETMWLKSYIDWHIGTTTVRE